MSLTLPYELHTTCKLHKFSIFCIQIGMFPWWLHK